MTEDSEPLVSHGLTMFLLHFLVWEHFNFHCCLWRNRKHLDLIKNILICVPKMNEGLLGLERREGEYNVSLHNLRKKGTQLLLGRYGTKAKRYSFVRISKCCILVQTSTSKVHIGIFERVRPQFCT